MQLLNRRQILGASIAAAALASCKAPAQAPGPHLRLIGHTRLPHKLQFQNTTVGGLSGLDYDPAKGVYYAISDDRSDYNPARFYTLKLPLTADTLGVPELLSVTTIQTPTGQPYPNRQTAGPNDEVPDGESIRLRVATNSLYWTSEGDAARGKAPFVREMRMDGSYVSQLALPAMFSFDPDKKMGVRNNLGLEGLAFTPGGDTLWAAMEGPLIQDGPPPTLGSAGGPIRFTQFATSSGQSIRQIAYMPDAIPNSSLIPGGPADNGVSEIWMGSEQGMLVLERSYALGVGNSIRLYQIDTQDGDDVIAMPKLEPGKFKPVAKRLLLDFASAGLPQLDNIEGMTRGPNLPNGNPTLIFVSDDNFSITQVTQFVAFEWLSA